MAVDQHYCGAFARESKRLLAVDSLSLTPAAVSAFFDELKDLQKHQHFEIPDPTYAEVHIVFQSDLILQKCHWTLSDGGRNFLREQAYLLWKIDRLIQRIEIVGLLEIVWKLFGGF
jgi:hypothetical protein